MSLNYNENRDMLNKPISSTFKGILRISNNNNLDTLSNDKFLSDEFYIEKDSSRWFGGGINLTQNFLSDDIKTNRFSSDDEYTNLKVPVTDSMGNYLNFSLGERGTLIGSTSTIVLEEKDAILGFKTLKASSLEIGKEERVKGEKKEIKGGNLYIESKGEHDGSLIIRNYFYKGVSDDDSDNDSDVNIKITDELKCRTIFNTKNLEKGDGFVYNQENHSSKEDDNNILTEVNCFVKQENVEKYIYEKISNYIKSKYSELPSGTIISQYCSLNKWYCLEDKSTISNDFEYWQGYRPAMNIGINTPFAYFNLLQNNAVKSTSFLYHEGNLESSDTEEGEELIPEFKRGYALCNGNPLKIYLCPDDVQNAENLQASLDLFFNLFYVIGYYYNDKNVKPPLRRVINRGTENNPDCQFLSNSVGYMYNDIDLDVAYTNTMAIILAFKKMQEILNSADNIISPQSLINMLKVSSIPEEYIFNSICDSHKNPLKYLYSSSSGEKIHINVGVEINSFSNKIPYYIFNESDSSYRLILIEIYKMAEVKEMAEKLLSSDKSINNWKNYNFQFSLPKLFTTTDTDANMGINYIDSRIKEATIGNFIGSNGLLMAKNFTITAGNGFEVKDIDKSYSPYQSHCIMSSGYFPHSHAIAKGKLTLEGNFKNVHYLPEDIDTEKVRVKGLSLPTIINGNQISKISNENIISGEYRYSPAQHSSIKNLNKDPQENYILQDITEEENIRNVELVNVVNYFNGMTGKQYQSTSDTTTYNWYGKTSAPVWESDETDLSDFTEKYVESNQGYFRPESIKVLPLIKL